jgi:hypothetical protein
MTKLSKKAKERIIISLTSEPVGKEVADAIDAGANTQAELDLITAELNLITDVNWTGDYNNGVTYNVGDGVFYNGASFRMISFIGAAGYPPPAYPGSWLQVTDYAPVPIESDTTGIAGANQITNMISLTQAEYDAIGTKSASTFYLITDVV